MVCETHWPKLKELYKTQLEIILGRKRRTWRGRWWMYRHPSSLILSSCLSSLQNWQKQKTNKQKTNNLMINWYTLLWITKQAKLFFWDNIYSWTWGVQKWKTDKLVITHCTRTGALIIQILHTFTSFPSQTYYSRAVVKEGIICIRLRHWWANGQGMNNLIVALYKLRNLSLLSEFAVCFFFPGAPSRN